MVSFFACLAGLIVGYMIYGAFVERVFHPDSRKTPCVDHPDGIDYLPLKPWKAFLIQLLNIAGLGPIFGALSGAIWGPSVFLWIVLGTIFIGAVHDFVSGMISMRHDGTSLSEIIGIYLGPTMKNIMRVFSMILLVMVGVVFMVGPAGLLAHLTTIDIKIWTIIILIYYFFATLLPIDKIIGKVYPIFGLCLIIMAVGIAGATIFNNGARPMAEITLANLHPKGTPIWPIMFIAVACGAISGFHATQSPMVARCLTSEKYGRKIFYGSMVSEGVIALIWAAAGCAFYQRTGGLMTGLLAVNGGNSSTVYEMSISLLGKVGGALAMIGVVACPITTGDTAFRSARLTISDWFKIGQKSTNQRLLLSIPLLVAGYLISLVDYQVIWRYFSWANQTLAVFTLWACSVFLVSHCKNRWFSFITVIPATFMSAVCVTYILVADEWFKLDRTVSYISGIAVALIFLCVFLFKTKFLTGKSKTFSANSLADTESRTEKTALNETKSKD